MSTNYQSNRGKIGLLTSFDPKYSRLSKHSSQLINCLNTDQIVILSNLEAKFKPEQYKNVNVINCWNAIQSDFSELFQVINSQQIKLLYVNCFQPFFRAQSFIPFINLCNLQGIEVVAEINSEAILDENLKEIIERLDSVVINDSLILAHATQNASAAAAASTDTKDVVEKPNSLRSQSKRLPRILMQSRPNAYTQPGGDTVVMDRVSEGLRARGITVDIDIKCEKKPRDYDLVHLFNFALKDHTEGLARNCIEQGTPYVVTTMYEDWPIFFNQMQAQFAALEGYIQSGQNRNAWSELNLRAKAVKPTPMWDNSFTANNAAALIATGEYEAKSLKRDYPKTRMVEVYHCGGEITENADNGEFFYKQTGLKDFVFCVGRFELRKNQLMLLKALEDSDLTVVFAGGGFTYQPEYLEACKQFKRKGKTVILDRLDPKMLTSAFQAAKIHVLPSWFELPGIVSIESARLERNVVVTEYGTARDYFSNYGFYCKPDDPESIYNAVTAAYYSPFNQELKKRVENFTWDVAAVRNGEIYQLALGNREDLDWTFLAESRTKPISTAERIEQTIVSAGSQTREAIETVRQIPEAVSPQNSQHTPSFSLSLRTENKMFVEIQELETLKKQKQIDLALEKIEKYLANKATLRKDDYDLFCIMKAEMIACKGRLSEAKTIFNSVNNDSFKARIITGKGVVSAAENDWQNALVLFEQAVAVNPEHDVALAGIAMCYSNKGDLEQAWDYYRKALVSNKENLSAIYGMIELGYKLNRLPILEKVLLSYLDLHPGDINILYSFAGALYAQGKFKESLEQLDKMLLLQPRNELALELKAKIQETTQRAVGNK